jgi:hypothetical protein
MLLARCDGPVTNTRLEPWPVDFAGFVAALHEPRIGPKDGSYFIRGGKFNGSTARADEHLLAADLLVLDGDKRVDPETGELYAGAPDPLLVHEALVAADIPHVIYTSHSNDRNFPRYRVCVAVPLTNQNELCACVDWLLDQLHQNGVWLAPGFENYGWTRPWYMPRVPDAAHAELFRFYEHDGGQPFPKAEALAWYHARQPPQEEKVAEGTSRPHDPESPIGRFVATHGPEWMVQTLEAQGYTLAYSRARGDTAEYRLLAPRSESRSPGVGVFLGRSGKWLVYSHHSPSHDPLAQPGPDGKAKPFDAFDLKVQFEHGGDFDAALAALGGSADASPRGDPPPEPEDIFKTPVPPRLDLDAALPPVLADFARDHALAAGHDPGAYAYAAVCAASSVIGHSVRVQILPRWIEPVLAWAALVGRSGSGKTPAMNHAVAPVHELHQQAVERYRAELSQWEAADAADAGDKPKPEHFYFANTTIEAIVDRMAGAAHQALRHADEGTGWLNAMGRYVQTGGDSERGDWLAGWNGLPYTVSRIRRGDQYLDAWAVAVLYGITPEKMKGVYAEAASDGLLARTLVYVLDRALWIERRPAIDPTASAAAYQKAVLRLAGQRERTLHMSIGADALWATQDKLWRDGTQLLAEVSPGLSSFLGKAPAMLARIAGLFHLLAGGSDEQITLETMRRAVAFMEHACSMARVAHMHLFAKDDAVAVARRIAAKVLIMGGERITRRDLSKVAAFQGADTMTQAAALRYLAGMNWLLGTDSQRLRTGPRFEEATAWLVNPLVHLRFAGLAEQAKQEAQRVHNLLKALGG